MNLLWKHCRSLLIILATRPNIHAPYALKIHKCCYSLGLPEATELPSPLRETARKHFRSWPASQYEPNNKKQRSPDALIRVDYV